MHLLFIIAQPQTWIAQHEQNIRKQHGHDVYSRKNNVQAKDHGIVAVVNGADEILPQPRNGEYLFNYERAAENAANAYAYHCNARKDGIAKYMAGNYMEPIHALCFGSKDIILIGRIEHA